MKELTKKQKYDLEYKKTHVKQLRIDLPLKEYEDMKQLMQETGITMVGLLRKGIEYQKKECK